MQTYIDDVIFPADILECDRIDIGIEKECDINEYEHVAHSLCAEREGQDLDGVANE
jgi:hypothetical protein